MAFSKETSTAVRLLWRRLGILGLFLLVLFLFSGVLSVYQKERESRVLRDAAEHKYSMLAEQHEKLTTDIQKLQTDRGKEEALREQYTVGREGERLIVIVEPLGQETEEVKPVLMEWVHRFLPFW